MRKITINKNVIIKNKLELAASVVKQVSFFSMLKPEFHLHIPK